MQKKIQCNSQTEIIVVAPPPDPCIRVRTDILNYIRVHKARGIIVLYIYFFFFFFAIVLEQWKSTWTRWLVFKQRFVG